MRYWAAISFVVACGLLDPWPVTLKRDTRILTHGTAVDISINQDNGWAAYICYLPLPSSGISTILYVQQILHLTEYSDLIMMKHSLLPAIAAVIIFPLYAFFGNAAFSLNVGLFIGAIAALYYIDLLGLNSAFVIAVSLFVLYQYIGDDAFYLFGLLFGLLFCLVGLFALSQLFQPAKGKGKLFLLLGLATPVAFGLGGYLVWVDASALGLWSLLGFAEQS